MQTEAQPAAKLEPTITQPQVTVKQPSVETKQPELKDVAKSQAKPKTKTPVKETPKKAAEPKAAAKPKTEAKAKAKGVTFEVTAYSLGDGFTPSHGITASGERVKEGRTMACSKELPFGTQIFFPDLDHTYTCTDRGGMITPGHADIYMESRKQALKFGRQHLEGIIIYKK
ncbi:3D domain-containing protein [Paenibacillus xylanexedens]|uniref:3D domain-containing protein n=1 Tax=Paenibacillus xylanexedens TaxID=528191 RepID=UPI0011A210C2|nr:3D domain-containing protein [Paenibacillus xylanexedens]